MTRVIVLHRTCTVNRERCALSCFGSYILVARRYIYIEIYIGLERPLDAPHLHWFSGHNSSIHTHTHADLHIQTHGRRAKGLLRWLPPAPAPVAANTAMCCDELCYTTAVLIES